MSLLWGNFMDLRDKIVLVTGGAGAVGSVLTRLLIERDCKKIIILDNLSSGFEANIPKSSKILFINGDVADDTVLAKVFSESIDVVFHLAANFANQNSVDNPTLDLHTNGQGTLKIFMQSQKHDVKLVVYVSSSCVYGGKQGELHEDDINFELDTPYAITKLLGEKYATYFHEIQRLDIVILRYFNSYGPGERPGKYRNVIPNWIAMALNNESLVITGTGHDISKQTNSN